MIPDEVVKVLKAELELCKRIGISHHLPNKDMLNRIEALSSAISLIQDYQKLRERVSVEKIAKLMGEFNGEPEETFLAESLTIVTYLGGGGK